MVLEKRNGARDLEAFVASNKMLQAPGRALFDAPDPLLADNDFDVFVEVMCTTYAVGMMSRPTIPTAHSGGCWFWVTFRN